MATAPRLPIPDRSPPDWTAHLRAILTRYDEPLLRQVANNLLRLRSWRSTDELVDKLTAAAENAAVIDRRVRDIDPEARGLIALIALSRQPRWRLGGLLELLSGLGAADGMAVIFHLFEVGLLYPELAAEKKRLKNLEEWLGRGTATAFRVFAHPQVTARAAGQDLPALDPALTVEAVTEPREADGLDWFLRLGALWQQVRALPLRLTQQGDFFKRDQDRLVTDALLCGPAADQLTSLPEIGHFVVSLGLGIGLLRLEDGQIVADASLPGWSATPSEALSDLWASLTTLDSWNAAEGWQGLGKNGASPYASAGVLVLGLLVGLPEGRWASPSAVADWLATRHCFWKSAGAGEGKGGQVLSALKRWADGFLLGMAYQLRLVEAAKDAAGDHVVRVSATGRAVLGLGSAPPSPTFPKTLLVQPNMEIIAYRQGLNPALIATLSRFCAWKALGAACTLQLGPDTVYRGLETGLPLEQMHLTLQQHSVREIPTGVVQSVRTWADKRERIAVYPAAALLEFNSAEELEQALGRGVPGIRVADTLIFVPNEGEIDFRHFRLTGTRDYGMPPGQCVAVEPDGVTLAVDVARSDLLLETEIERFADKAGSDGSARRLYRMTPGSLARGRERGIGIRNLEEWFPQRTGEPLPPAARLLLAGAELPPLTVRQLTVVEAPSAIIADGLMQWPATRALIHARLGPQALVVRAEDLEAFRVRCGELAVRLEEG